MLEHNKNLVFLKKPKMIFGKVMLQWVTVSIIVITKSKMTLKLNFRSINFRFQREHQIKTFKFEESNGKWQIVSSVFSKSSNLLRNEGLEK